jgi:hypothetical protein
VNASIELAMRTPVGMITGIGRVLSVQPGYAISSIDAKPFVTCARARAQTCRDETLIIFPSSMRGMLQNPNVKLSMYEVMKKGMRCLQ